MTGYFELFVAYRVVAVFFYLLLFRTLIRLGDPNLYVQVCMHFAFLYRHTHARATHRLRHPLESVAARVRRIGDTRTCTKNTQIRVCLCVCALCER
jgi:hypothetical protein